MSGSRCALCKKPIRWVVTTEGRRIQLDPQPSSLGRVWLRPDDGLARFLNKEEQQRGRAAGAVLWNIHRATCPSVERHRGISREQTALDLFGGDAA